MNKNNNLHKCKDCNSFDSIYQKSAYSFDETNLGICALNQEIVEKEHICKFYKTRVKQVETITPEHIDAVIEDVQELEKIFYNFDC